MVYPIGKRVIPPVVKLWIRKVNGLRNLPKSGFIIAANHASYMDHPIILSIFVLHLNKKVHFLSKKEHFDNPLKAAWHSWGGAIPLDREKKGDASL